jgi:hypothetical protein
MSVRQQTDERTVRVDPRYKVNMSHLAQVFLCRKLNQAEGLNEG